MIDDAPDLPPADALIVAEPAATPVTSPLDETVATAVLDDVHVKVVAEPGGLAVAVSCVVAPAAMVALDGETEIDLTDLGCPPLANDGDNVSVADGAEVSEHAANANAIPAAVRAAEPRRMDRVRIRACLSVVGDFEGQRFRRTGGARRVGPGERGCRDVMVPAQRSPGHVVGSVASE